MGRSQATQHAGLNDFARSLERAAGENVADQLDVLVHACSGIRSLRAFSKLWVGTVVDALHHRLVALEPARPDPFVLLADLELPFVDMVEPDVPRRFLLVGQILAVLVGVRIPGRARDTTRVRRSRACRTSFCFSAWRRRACVSTSARPSSNPSSVLLRTETTRDARPSACRQRRRRCGSSRASAADRTCGRDT